MIKCLRSYLQTVLLINLNVNLANCGTERKMKFNKTLVVKLTLWCWIWRRICYRHAPCIHFYFLKSMLLFINAKGTMDVQISQTLSFVLGLQVNCNFIVRETWVTPDSVYDPSLSLTLDVLCQKYNCAPVLWNWVMSDFPFAQPTSVITSSMWGNFMVT